MHIFVGSTNPVKINAVRVAVKQHWPKAVVKGYEVESDVSAQPMSDEETQLGAANRAQAAMDKGISEFKAKLTASSEVLAIGLEGGVTQNEQGELWTTVWGVVLDVHGQRFDSCGARIKVEDQIAAAIISGQEMGPYIEQMTGKKELRKKQGYFGLVTNNFVDRTEEYSAVIKIAIGLWFGRNWLTEFS